MRRWLPWMCLLLGGQGKMYNIRRGSGHRYRNHVARLLRILVVPPYQRVRHRLLPPLCLNINSLLCPRIQRRRMPIRGHRVRLRRNLSENENGNGNENENENESISTDMDMGIIINLTNIYHIHTRKYMNTLTAHRMRIHPSTNREFRGCTPMNIRRSPLICTCMSASR